MKVGHCGLHWLQKKDMAARGVYSGKDIPRQVKRRGGVRRTMQPRVRIIHGIVDDMAAMVKVRDDGEGRWLPRVPEVKRARGFVNVIAKIPDPIIVRSK